MRSKYAIPRWVCGALILVVTGGYLVPLRGMREAPILSGPAVSGPAVPQSGIDLTLTSAISVNTELDVTGLLKAPQCAAGDASCVRLIRVCRDSDCISLPTGETPLDVSLVVTTKGVTTVRHIARITPKLAPAVLGTRQP